MRDGMSIQCGCFKPHADDFERNRPKRMTDQGLRELQNEYTLPAVVFETRLRVPLLCAENAEGRPRTWAE
jgi:hypothetical protein